MRRLHLCKWSLVKRRLSTINIGPIKPRNDNHWLSQPCIGFQASLASSASCRALSLMSCFFQFATHSTEATRLAIMPHFQVRNTSTFLVHGNLPDNGLCGSLVPFVERIARTGFREVTVERLVVGDGLLLSHGPFYFRQSVQFPRLS